MAEISQSEKYINPENNINMSDNDTLNNLDAAKREIQLLMSSIPGGVCRFIYDGGLQVDYANEGMYALIQMTPEEFEKEYQNRYENILSAKQWAELKEKIEKAKDGEILKAEYAVHYRGRKEEWRLMQAVVLENNNTKILQSVIADITDIKKTYLQLEQEKDKLNIIAEMSGDLLFEYDITRDTMYFTKQSESIINEEEVVVNYTKTISQTGYMHPKDVEALDRFCQELRAGKKHICAELRKKYRDGQYHWIELEGKTLFDHTGNPVKVIGHTKNVDDRKRNEARIRKSLERDSMTGLYNRQAVVDKVKAKLQKKKARDTDWLLLVDVDNFKKINDQNGHLVGDAVLCMVADELKTSFKKGLIGRIGGDEFLAYLDKMSREDVENVLRELNDTVRDAYKDTDRKLEISCSIGVVECKHIQDYETLFQWADYALYQVKRNTKDGYYIETPGVDDVVPEVGYLEHVKEVAYEREEVVINSAEELAIFSLELLTNVPDRDSALKMVSDRICNFYDIDDIAYITIGDSVKSKRYHWSRRDKRETAQRILAESKEAWEYILSNFDARGMFALRKEAISHMPGEQVGSILFIHIKQEEEQGYVAFIDRLKDRNWEDEKDGLQKLARILVNHLHQIHDLKKEKSKIENRMNYDSVTGLPRYQKFINYVEQRMQEEPDEKYYFVYSDFVNFRYVNEMYGYAEGDKILEAFAGRVSELSNAVWFTRITSDHFVGLLKGDNEEKVREKYLEATTQFCHEINQKYDQCNLIMVSGFSGVQAGESASYVIDKANVARKYGKDTANTVVISYDQQIREKNEAEKAMIAHMVTALENGEFKAWLQPKISLKTDKVVGAEALVRWQRPDGSMIYPDKFIPFFERNGFVSNVDFAVLEQVLAYLRIAMDAGEQVVPISVNFSRRHNEELDFVDHVMQRLDHYRIPPHYLEAELTESIFMLDLSKLTDNIRKLKDKGVLISIDDFGSGYSSLNVLANVEADIIKLDRIFLNYAEDDTKAMVFVKYLVKMMKNMGYQVLAEGVETKEQLTLLSNAECDMVQGYYYAKPMPISEFRKFIKEYNKE